MKRIFVTLQGISPYYVSKMESSDKPGAYEKAADIANRKDEKYFLSGEMIEHALYFSAKGIKAKRRSVQKLIKQGAIRVKEKEVRVTGKPEVSKYQLVDSRNMVKMWSYYIRMNEWQVSFSLLFDDSILDLGFVNYLLGLSGRIVGFGKGCPRLGGPFGKFISTRFESD